MNNLAYAYALSAYRVANKLNDSSLRSRSMSAMNKARSTGAERYKPDFMSHVCGIPCGVFIDDFDPGEEATDVCPGERPSAEFQLLDRKGYPAQWLHDKASECDLDWIHAECLDHLSKAGESATTDALIAQFEDIENDHA